MTKTVKSEGDGKLGRASEIERFDQKIAKEIIRSGMTEMPKAAMSHHVILRPPFLILSRPQWEKSSIRKKNPFDVGYR